MKTLLYPNNFLKQVLPTFIITVTLFAHLIFNLAPLLLLNFFTYVFISLFIHPCESFYESN